MKHLKRRIPITIPLRANTATPLKYWSRSQVMSCASTSNICNGSKTTGEIADPLLISRVRIFHTGVATGFSGVATFLGSAANSDNEQYLCRR